MTLNEETHGRLTPDKVKKIIKEKRRQAEEEKSAGKGASQDA